MPNATWASQPQYPVSIHPAWARNARLVLCGDMRSNLARALSITHNNTGVTTTAGYGLRGLSFSGASPGNGPLASVGPDTSQWTLLFVAALQTSAANARIISSYAGSTTNGGPDLYYTTQGAVSLMYQWGTSSTAGARYIALPESGNTFRPSAHCISHNLSGAVNTSPIWALNGALATQTSFATATGTRRALQPLLALGHRQDVTNRQFVGQIYLVALFDVAVSADIARSLSRNPWQIFAPITRRVYLLSPSIPMALAAVEAPDVAAFEILTVGTQALDATEAADVAAFEIEPTPQITLAATEQHDVAAFEIVTVGVQSLAATEQHDVAEFTINEPEEVTLQAVEASDVASFEIEPTPQIVLAATEAPDVAAFASFTVGTQLLDATEAADVASFTLTADNEHALVATEAADVAAFELVAEAVPVTAGGSVPWPLYRREYRRPREAMHMRASEAQDTARFVVQPFRSTVEGRAKRRRDELALILALGRE